MAICNWQYRKLTLALWLLRGHWALTQRMLVAAWIERREADQQLLLQQEQEREHFQEDNEDHNLAVEEQAGQVELQVDAPGACAKDKRRARNTHDTYLWDNLRNANTSIITARIKPGPGTQREGERWREAAVGLRRKKSRRHCLDSEGMPLRLVQPDRGATTRVSSVGEHQCSVSLKKSSIHLGRCDRGKHYALTH